MHPMTLDAALTSSSPQDLATFLIEAAPASTPELLPLPWPEGLEPQRITQDVVDSDPLPKADVLITTYTTNEGFALADILTPGVPTSEWTPYRNNWPAIKGLIEGGRAPSLQYDRAGLWALTKIGDVTAVLVKSDLHPATDGPNLPIVTAWQQWIQQVQPKLVLTTGTAGAVQATTLLGDVVVARHVSWDCKHAFKNKPFAAESYRSSASLVADWFNETETLIKVNAGKLPITLPPKVWADSSHPAHVITTDFFAFDDAADTYGLRTFDSRARAVEMDDAALCVALQGLTDPPVWFSVRNASDPQMTGTDIAAEAKQAASIYLKYGQITSWGSALACWALCTHLGEI